MRISIIGTSGRGHNSELMDKNLYLSMLQKVSNIVDSLGIGNECVDLISGGAAWADHLVISLMIMNRQNTISENYKSVTLYLPCDWRDGKHDDNCCTGKTANNLHKKFSNIININSLDQIEWCKNNGGIIDSSNKGFKNRNTVVAKCDILIAFTWFEGNKPLSGGSCDTWNKAKNANRIHIPLKTLKY